MMTAALALLLASSVLAQTKTGPVEAVVPAVPAVPAVSVPAAPDLSQPASPILPAPASLAPKPSLKAAPEAARTRAAALPAAAVPQAVNAAVAQPAPPGLAPIPAADDAAGSPSAQLSDTAGRAAPERGLDASFKALTRLFDGKRDEASEGNSVVPENDRRLIVGKVRARFLAQLAAMEKLAPQDHTLIAQVRSEGTALLAEIEGHMARGEIDPRADVRTSRLDLPAAPSARELRVGVYPVAADPFQWAHILIGLRAMAAFRLDKVVYVLAGDDPRKPNLTKADFRHPMGRAVLDTFAPLFEYSAIAVGTTHDGETNIFRMLALNKAQRLKAFYLVGGDHYRLKDKNGDDDTLPKIEKRLADPAAGHQPGLHGVEVAFIAREGMDAHVPTSLEVHFLPNMAFEASSTLVRGGQHALMPYAAYEYVRQRRPGLYGIGAKDD